MTDPLATAMLSPTNIAMMSSVGQKDQFDFIPLVIEIVFLVLFLISSAVVEVLLRKGVLAKEDTRGPTKIHLQHLKVYNEQEQAFLESGGLANNKSREPQPSSTQQASSSALVK